MALEKELFSPNIAIPKILTLLIEGCNVKSEKAPRHFFEQAISTFANDITLSPQEKKRGHALFRTLNPKDDAERVWSAQSVVSYILGMHNISLPLDKDKQIDIKLLRAAGDAMKQIQKKRNSYSST